MAENNELADDGMNLSGNHANDSMPMWMSPPTHLPSDFVEMALIFLIMMIGTPLNIAVLLKCVKEMNSTPRDGLRWGFLLMKFNLNASDLLLLIGFCFGRLMWLATYEWMGGDVLCRLYQFLTFVAFYSSSNVVVCISLDRLRNVLAAKRVRTNTASQVRALLLAAWVLAFLWAFPQLLVWHSADVIPNAIGGQGWYQCVPLLQYDVRFRNTRYKDVYNLVHLLLVFWLPTVVMTVCYVVIAIRLIHYADRGPPGSKYSTNNSTVLSKMDKNKQSASQTLLKKCQTSANDLQLQTEGNETEKPPPYAVAVAVDDANVRVCEDEPTTSSEHRNNDCVSRNVMNGSGLPEERQQRVLVKINDVELVTNNSNHENISTHQTSKRTGFGAYIKRHLGYIPIKRNKRMDVKKISESEAKPSTSSAVDIDPQLRQSNDETNQNDITGAEIRNMDTMGGQLRPEAVTAGRRMKKISNAMMKHASDAARRLSHHHRHDEAIEDKRPSWRRQLRSRVFRTTLLVVITHIVFWMPYNTMAISMYVKPSLYELFDKYVNYVKDIQVLIAIVNPMLYALS